MKPSPDNFMHNEYGESRDLLMQSTATHTSQTATPLCDHHHIRVTAGTQVVEPSAIMWQLGKAPRFRAAIARQLVVHQ